MSKNIKRSLANGLFCGRLHFEGSLAAVEDPLIDLDPFEARAAFTLAAFFGLDLFQRQITQDLIDQVHLLGSFSLLGYTTFFGLDLLFFAALTRLFCITAFVRGMGLGLSQVALKFDKLHIICIDFLNVEHFQTWLRFLRVVGGHYWDLRVLNCPTNEVFLIC